MRIRVLYFQNVRKITGIAEESLDLDGAPTVGDLAEELAGRHPGLRETLTSLLFAVNETHARPADRLSGGDTVAVMPPFSGG